MGLKMRFGAYPISGDTQRVFRQGRLPGVCLRVLAKAGETSYAFMMLVGSAKASECRTMRHHAAA